VWPHGRPPRTRLSLQIANFVPLPAAAFCPRAPPPSPCRRVLTATQLLAERLDAAAAEWAQLAAGGGGYDLCAEALRAAGHPMLSAEVVLLKAARMLADGGVAAAAEVFKGFEAREAALRCARRGVWGWA
jgi:hypothetical protein